MSEQEEISAEERALDEELLIVGQEHRQWLDSFDPEQRAKIEKLREAHFAHMRGLDKALRAQIVCSEMVAELEVVFAGKPQPGWLKDAIANATLHQESK